MLFLKYCCVNVTGTGCFKKMIALLSNIEIRKRNVHGSIKTIYGYGFHTLLRTPGYVSAYLLVC